MTVFPAVDCITPARRAGARPLQTVPVQVVIWLAFCCIFLGVLPQVMYKGLSGMLRSRGGRFVVEWKPPGSDAAMVRLSRPCLGWRQMRRKGSADLWHVCSVELGFGLLEDISCVQPCQGLSPGSLAFALQITSVPELVRNGGEGNPKRWRALVRTPGKADPQAFTVLNALPCAD
jgi:hypothetical protein